MTDISEDLQLKKEVEAIYHSIASELKEFDCVIYNVAVNYYMSTPLASMGVSLADKSFMIALFMADMIELNYQGSVSAKGLETIQTGSTSMDFRTGDEMIAFYSERTNRQYYIYYNKYSYGD